MRIAVFSDMHGNAVAFDAVIADFRRAAPDALVCLGDCVQGGPQPAEVVERLRALACPVVMGNADAFVVENAGTGAEVIDEDRRKKMDAVREWTLSKLAAPDVAFVRAFHPTVELEIDATRRLLGYHGSPKSFDDLIVAATPSEKVRAWLEPNDDTIYTGGHTHVQFVRHFGRTFHFNPGSVGLAYRHDQPEDGFHADPWAEYALLTVDGPSLSLDFRRVPFDVERLADQCRASGRPFAEDYIAQYAGA